MGELRSMTFSIVGQEFTQFFMVAYIPSSSPFSIMLGHPWLYIAKVKDDYERKKLSLGNPRLVIC
ncbi:hypothetical protein, partial [Burkholderia sp. GbtcB21]|uniref:hypothetical protein n=1 Tax=Burkholderia sp. GbtcB21 TaxID=2824766 RepID=UPI001C2FB923